MTTFITTLILATFITLVSAQSAEPETTPPPNEQVVQTNEKPPFANATELLQALSTHDRATTSLTGQIRFTNINALENDRQQRLGKLAIKSVPDSEQRLYAVIFQKLIIDDRQETIDEHFIFDGRWFVERLPEEKQFNKRELVAVGQTLDPMELMRDAPFWVSVGQDQDRLLKSYDAELLPTTQSLVDNPDFPELANLVPLVNNGVQLKLTPKQNTAVEDDWESVRIWINPETLDPILYIKADWIGDLQIVELFGVKSNTQISQDIFDTTTPDPRDGWNVQLSHWRGKDNNQNQGQE